MVVISGSALWSLIGPVFVPFLAVWLAILAVFYGLDLPLGPGAELKIK
ncbi:hypothetical protein OKJ48_23775 [Streptomyces kunmingensis]|uniref:Uncharacterized protein n=1 Tax=Streptomyces kunmingensis TaxID=68225 RepID=A0ABU6CEU4_9ACTN|nr:hypothetical protein [Streptomyces kunmingensis]MEB3963239.1 hypothetical protein [Streptomyces kunmingensis]